MSGSSFIMKGSKLKPGIVRIGTSGIVVPGNKQTFPEEFQSRSRLHYYSSLFNTIEINSSFYKIPLPGTFEKWSAEVSENFKFTVKLWRGITHGKKLAYTKEDIHVFMNAANHLGKKKGCLLLQFPASIKFEYLKEVESIIRQLDKLNVDGKWEMSIELRDASWYKNDFYALLNEYKTSLVFHDIVASKTPMTNPATNIIYLRFHGPKGDYRGSYTNDFLQDYANRIRGWTKCGKDVYVYFNNTMGSAFQNAQLLQQLI